ncbi:MAG: tRNA (adenosine(37)-N6)-threonylcarbamoyltransferase complex ATPase subunit type 1 TsaE [Acidobacteriota bacterium]
MNLHRKYKSETHESSFAIGEKIGQELCSGDVVLLYGGLGAGKTSIAKGILNSLEFDVDEVTSPSFSLVNLYKTPHFDVYHLDLWRLDASHDVAMAVGLDDILDNDKAITLIEWADRLDGLDIGSRVITVIIAGDGDDERQIDISISDPRESSHLQRAEID